jgi:hypothetical protein
MIEITTFRLHVGVEVQTFALLDARLQTEFFYVQPGLQRRTTVRSDDGTWASIIVWDSPEQADAAIEKTEDFALFGDVLSMMDLMTIESRRYDTL